MIASAAPTHVSLVTRIRASTLRFVTSASRLTTVDKLHSLGSGFHLVMRISISISIYRHQSQNGIDRFEENIHILIALIYDYSIYCTFQIFFNSLVFS